MVSTVCALTKLGIRKNIAKCLLSREDVFGLLDFVS